MVVSISTFMAPGFVLVTSPSFSFVLILGLDVIIVWPFNLDPWSSCSCIGVCASCLCIVFVHHVRALTQSCLVYSLSCFGFVFFWFLLCLILLLFAFLSYCGFCSRYVFPVRFFVCLFVCCCCCCCCRCRCCCRCCLQGLISNTILRSPVFHRIPDVYIVTFEPSIFVPFSLQVLCKGYSQKLSTSPLSGSRLVREFLILTVESYRHC